MGLNEFADKIEKAALTVSRILGVHRVPSPCPGSDGDGGSSGGRADVDPCRSLVSPC
jgi:hypothetical protein